MPLVNIEYDDKQISDEEATQLSQAVQKIVSEATQIKDVFVYGNSSRIKVEIAPIEIFIQMSDHKINDIDELTKLIVTNIGNWKLKTNFKHLINLTVIPMKWKIEIGI